MMTVSVTDQFLEGSSLHGLRHLGRPATQRLFWTCVLSLAAALMIHYVLQYWSLTYEVLVMVENPHQNLEDFAFPAVTVCPAIKALKSKVHGIAETFVDKVNLTQFENAVITMTLLKYPFYHLAHDFFESVHEDVTPLEDEDLRNIMYMVKADLDTVLEDCEWRAQPHPCKELFRLQMTHEGYCFSFNSKTAFRFPTDRPELPPVVGPDGGLEALKSRSDSVNSGLGFRLRPLARERLTGDPHTDLYSVAVHDGTLQPDMALAISVLPDRPRVVACVDVSVSIIEADNTVVSLPEKTRGCNTHQGGDGKEAVNDCMQNCRDSEVVRRCGCMPNLRIHSDVHPRLIPVMCSFKHLSCLKEVSGYLRSTQATLGKPGYPPWSRNHSIPSACLPPCSFTTYSTDFTEIPYSPRKEGAAGTWVRVDYKGPGMKYARSARMNLRDVLVGSGSMASFLLGFSAVAVFDAAVYVVKLLYGHVVDAHVAQNAASEYPFGSCRSTTRPLGLPGPDKVVMFGSDKFYVHEYKDHTHIPIYPFVN